jgi:drug/metabolite transporter (DMT)-like permease
MSAPASPPPPRSFQAEAAYPLLFVLLWSTGFIGAKFGLPHAEPLTFLSVRYAVVIALMGAGLLLWPAPCPACW